MIAASHTGRHGMTHQEPSIAEGTLDRLRAAQADIREEYLAANQDPWIIGYSGGKDSTLLVPVHFGPASLSLTGPV